MNKKYNTRYIVYKQSVVKYSYRHGVNKQQWYIECTQEKTIYRWRAKYDGTAESLAK